jgi:hypothetical protein
VQLSYAGEWNPGQIHKLLTVMTDDPKQPIIRVPIEAR